MVGADRHGAASSLCRILGGRLLQVRWSCHTLSDPQGATHGEPEPGCHQDLSV